MGECASSDLPLPVKKGKKPPRTAVPDFRVREGLPGEIRGVSELNEARGRSFAFKARMEGQRRWPLVAY